MHLRGRAPVQLDKAVKVVITPLVHVTEGVLEARVSFIKISLKRLIASCECSSLENGNGLRISSVSQSAAATSTVSRLTALAIVSASAPS
jgi:hypothetical protein